MTYPNAAKGVKKLFIAEIFSIIVIALTLIATVLSIVAMANGSLSLLGVAGVIAIILGILAIVALILRIVGLVNASKDEQAFKIALIAVIASLVLSVVKVFTSGTFAAILQLLVNLGSLVCFIYCIEGIRRLAEALNRPDVAKLGKSLLWMILIIGVVNIILALLSTFLGSAANVLNLLVSIASIVEEILFIILLAKGKNMLAQN